MAGDRKNPSRRITEIEPSKKMHRRGLLRAALVLAGRLGLLARSPPFLGSELWISKLEEFYSLTMTGVPSGEASKKCSAIPLGKRMQPCDAAYGGT